MFNSVGRKRLNEEQISSDSVKRQQLVDMKAPPKLRRSTQKICKICNISAEYYHEIFCTNCGSTYNKILE